MANLAEVLAVLHQRLEPAQRVNHSIPASSYDGERYLNNLERIECADGFAMSVQASHFHYCTPRNSSGPWSAVEVGFPTAKVDAFMPFIDGGPDDDPTGTVYGYVPVEIVAQAIVEHGGFATASEAA